jgi:hypothetical protein
MVALANETIALPAAEEPMKVLADEGRSYMARLAVSAWIALPDHPRKRDTARQSRKSHWEAVRAATGAARESVRWVVAAELDGQIYKVDGHTRALLWASGKLPHPDGVLATVYRCKNREELNALHATFDTQAAAETVFDKVSGAFSEQGLVLTSKRLRSGTIADALSIATRGVARGTDAEGGSADDFDVYGAVALYADELRLLDTVNPQNETFYTGLLAAALLSLACNPETLAFFRAISNGHGQTRAGLLDPVAGVLALISRMKNRRARFRREQERLCESSLGAMRVWLQGERAPGYWSSGRYEPVDILETVRTVRERKRCGSQNSSTS